MIKSQVAGSESKFTSVNSITPTKVDFKKQYNIETAGVETYPID